MSRGHPAVDREADRSAVGGTLQDPGNKKGFLADLGLDTRKHIVAFGTRLHACQGLPALQSCCQFDAPRSHCIGFMSSK